MIIKRDEAKKLWITVLSLVFIGIGVSVIKNPVNLGSKAAANATSYMSFMKTPLDYWMSKQQDDGNFRDDLDDMTVPVFQYGHSNLGAVLVWYGITNKDEAKVTAGIRALMYHINSWKNIRDNDLYTTTYHPPFNALAVAYAYNMLKGTGKLSSDDKLAFENYLKRYKTIYNGQVAGYINNWQLVEAAFFSQLKLSGLGTNGSTDKRLMSGNIDSWDKYYTDSLLSASMSASDKLADGGIGGDPLEWPTTYHVFSTALVARYLIDHQGSMETNDNLKTIRGTFLKMSDATLDLIGPDGDIAYYGRSNQQSVALGAVIFSMEYAANIKKASGELDQAGKYKKAAELAYDRLFNVHGLGGDNGNYINIIPALKKEFKRYALDYYASLPTYNGLTMLFLTMAADISDPTITAKLIPAETESFSRVFPQAGFAVMKKGDWWMMVANGRISGQLKEFGVANSDLRYDFGLIRLKNKTETGWVDIIPARPDIRASSDYTLGLGRLKWTLAPRGFYLGVPFMLEGTQMTISGNVLRQTAKLVNRGNGADMGMNTTISYELTADGVKMSVPPYPAGVNNYYVSMLFDGTPTKQRMGCEEVLSDNNRTAIFTSKFGVNQGLDPRKFNSSDIGEVTFDRLDIANQGRTVEIMITSADKLAEKAPVCLVLYWGSTAIPERVALEAHYGLKWLGHAGLPLGMSLSTARSTGLVGSTYWPAYSIYEKKPGVVFNVSDNKYLEPQETYGTSKKAIYFGSLPVSNRVVLETKYNLKWLGHAGLPLGMGLAAARSAGLIGSSYWPPYSIYETVPVNAGTDLKKYYDPMEISY